MCRKEEENGYWVIRSVDCNTDNKTSHIFHVLLHFLAKIFFFLAKIYDKSFLLSSNVHSLFLYEKIRHSCALPWGLQCFFPESSASLSMPLALNNEIYADIKDKLELKRNCPTLRK